MTEPVPAPTSEETVIWTGSPSQWVNAGWYIACVIGVVAPVVIATLTGQPLFAALAIIPIITALAKYLVVR